MEDVDNKYTGILLYGYCNLVSTVAQNFGDRKLWQFATNPPKFYPPNYVAV